MREIKRQKIGKDHCGGVWSAARILTDRAVRICFPEKCPLCGQILKKDQLVCQKCRKALLQIKGTRCKKCGKLMEHPEEEYCKDCRKGSHVYSRGLCIFPYEGNLRKAVQRFKYQNLRCYARFFGTVMAAKAQKQLKSWQPDVVIPIPLHKERLKKRGYNQAFLLAEVIGEWTQIPVLEHGLIRIAKTDPQKNLDRKKRQINLKRAFKIGPDDVKLKRVLLVDDIYTTGSTVDAAAQILLEAGAESVFFLALCGGQAQQQE